jgi:hypothetical protein
VLDVMTEAEIVCEMSKVMKVCVVGRTWLKGMYSLILDGFVV